MNAKTTFRVISSLLGAAAGCALFVGSVEAGDRTVTEAYQVKTQDLDLTRPADAKILYVRLQNAAWFVCEQGMRADLRPVDNFKGCYEKALGEGVRATNNPMVTQAYLATHTSQDAAARGIELPRQVAAK